MVYIIISIVQSRCRPVPLHKIQWKRKQRRWEGRKLKDWFQVQKCVHFFSRWIEINHWHERFSFFMDLACYHEIFCILLLTQTSGEDVCEEPFFITRTLMFTVCILRKMGFRFSWQSRVAISTAASCHIHPASQASRTHSSPRLAGRQERDKKYKEKICCESSGWRDYLGLKEIAIIALVQLWSFRIRSKSSAYPLNCSIESSSPELLGAAETFTHHSVSDSSTYVVASLHWILFKELSWSQCKL